MHVASEAEQKKSESEQKAWLQKIKKHFPSQLTLLSKTTQVHVCFLEQEKSLIFTFRFSLEKKWSKCPCVEHTLAFSYTMNQPFTHLV